MGGCLLAFVCKLGWAANRLLWNAQFVYRDLFSKGRRFMELFFMALSNEWGPAGSPAFSLTPGAEVLCWSLDWRRWRWPAGKPLAHSVLEFLWVLLAGAELPKQQTTEREKTSSFQNILPMNTYLIWKKVNQPFPLVSSSDLFWEHSLPPRPSRKPADEPLARLCLCMNLL